MAPPLVLVAFVALEVALSAAFPRPRPGPGALPAAGVALMALGVWLHVEADRRFRAAGTTRATRGLPGRLVTDGVYGRTRNPMYLGGALFLAGLAVLLGTAAGLVVPLLWVPVAGRLWIAPEEEVLERRFGDRYRSYREDVRRWV